MERNEALKFTEKDVKNIQEILNSFSLISEKMDITISTGTNLTTDKEVIETYFILDDRKFWQTYKKSVACTWSNILNKIEADLFAQLRKFADMKEEIVSKKYEWTDIIKPYGRM